MAQERKVKKNSKTGSMSATEDAKEYRVSGNRANFVLNELEPATYYDLTLTSNNSAGSSQDVYTFGTYTIAGSQTHST